MDTEVMSVATNGNETRVSAGRVLRAGENFVLSHPQLSRRALGLLRVPGSEGRLAWDGPFPDSLRVAFEPSP